MTIARLNVRSAIEQTSRSLGLPLDGLGLLSSGLVAQALRRACSILAPCARRDLERSVRETLKPIAPSGELLPGLVEDALDALLLYRDLLEVHGEEPDMWRESATSIRPSALSFVEREDGSTVILGTAGDVITPIPKDLPARLEYRGVLRVLVPTTSEALGPRLQEFGLQCLGEKAWLRIPKAEAACLHRETWQRRLQAIQPGQPPSELLICKPAERGVIYRDRWKPPEQQADLGIFIARRPQRYGADLWCLVDLLPNVSMRLLDLTSTDKTLRACDIAWQLLIAMDVDSSSPQGFKQHTELEQTRLLFYSPVPSWAERKLSLAGEYQPTPHCLFSYAFPTSAVAAQKAFLRESLWLIEHP